MFRPKFSLFWLVGVLCIFLCVRYSDTKSCMESDKQALLRLKDGFIDEWGILSTWKWGVDCCQWSRISCNNLTGHVTKLDLQVFDYNKRLRGNLDSSLCDLQYLIHLNLESNDFDGSEIPKCIGSLGQLRELRLSSAVIGGNIPHGLQNLSNLQILDLGYNSHLIVNDLEWIANLSSLKCLDLSAVNLSRAIDRQSSLLGASTSLESVYLDGSSLHHIGPKTFANMISLKSLSLDSASLQHIALDAFTNSTSLEHLDLEDNELDSSMVSSISNLCQLKELLLSSNKFSGSVM